MVVENPHADPVGIKELALQEFLKTANSLSDAETSITQAYNHHRMSIELWLDFSNLCVAMVPMLNELMIDEKSYSPVYYGPLCYYTVVIDGKKCVISLERDDEDTRLAGLVSDLVGEPVGTFFIRYKKYVEPGPSISRDILAEIEKRSRVEGTVPGYHCQTCPVAYNCPALEKPLGDKHELSAGFFLHKGASEDARERLRQILLLEGPQTLAGADWHFHTEVHKSVTDPGKMRELLGDKLLDYIDFKAKKIEKDFKTNLDVLKLIEESSKHSIRYRRKKKK